MSFLGYTSSIADSYWAGGTYLQGTGSLMQVGIILSTYSSRRSAGSNNYGPGASQSYFNFGSDPSYRDLVTS